MWLTAPIAIFTAAAAILLAVLPAIVSHIAAQMELRRPNFRGETIPTGFGMVILFWVAPLFVTIVFLAAMLRRESPILGFVAAHWREWIGYANITVGFGVFGFIDDLCGDRSSSGLVGHSRKLWREGRVTTGFVKAAGGLAVAYLVAHYTLGHPWTLALLEGAIIALSANAVNLLDLRPGRACAAFLLMAASLAVIQAIGRVFTPLILIIIPTIIVYVPDARGKVMIGDTGSNLLGASLGLAYVLAFPLPAALWAALALLVVLHLIAERYSLTELIEGNRFLRRLDSWTGVR